MARNNQPPEFAIQVAGEPYVWRLHNLPQWARNPADSRGKAIAVRHAEGQREAILQFPLGDRPKYGAALLKASHIPPALVAKAIASAIAAGWEPHSRGKPVTIVVDDDGA